MKTTTFAVILALAAIVAPTEIEDPAGVPDLGIPDAARDADPTELTAIRTAQLALAAGADRDAVYAALRRELGRLDLALARLEGSRR